MFRDDEQRSAVCRALLTRGHLGYLWKENKPTPTLVSIGQGEPSGLSSGQHVLACIVFALWTSEGGPLFAEVSRLDHWLLKAVGSLLVELGRGSDAIDDWLEIWAGSAQMAD